MIAPDTPSCMPLKSASFISTVRVTGWLLEQSSPLNVKELKPGSPLMPSEMCLAPSASSSLPATSSCMSGFIRSKNAAAMIAPDTPSCMPLKSASFISTVRVTGWLLEQSSPLNVKELKPGSPLMPSAMCLAPSASSSLPATFNASSDSHCGNTLAATLTPSASS